MSPKSKTGDKLVASIRKSKTGTVANKTSQRSDSDKSTAKTKAAASKSASKAVTSKPAPSAAKQDRGSTFNPTFSHGRRVWPD